MDDAELLRRYADTRDEAAFAELVRRHADLVYSAARRQVGGNHHRAQEVTQMVFLALARKAAALARHPLLVAWLFNTARRCAQKSHRTSARRLARETTAATDAALTSPASSDSSAEPPADWARVEPLLDDALATLGEADRQAVLLRYFTGHAYSDIGQKLGLAENTARMRTDRALEKLRRALSKRGVTSTASALGLALGANAVTAAPASVAAATLAALASPAALATAATSASALTFLTTMTTSTKLTLGVSAAVIAAAGIGWGVYHAQENSPREVNLPPAGNNSASVSSAASGGNPANAPTKASGPSSTAVSVPTLADALALPDAFKRKLALTAIGHDSAAADSAQALALLAQIKAPADRAAFIEGMMAAAAKMSAPDAVAFSAELAAGEDRRMGLTALAANWGVNLNAPDTIDYIRSAGLEGALGVLVAVQSPERGVAWAEGLLDGLDRRQALHDSLRQLARSNPQAALAYATNAADPHEKRSLLTGVALGWAEKDGPAAFAWASSLSANAATRADALSAATLFWAKTDLGAATQAALSQPADLQARTLGTIATSLYHRDPAGAAAWVEKLPESKAKNAAMNALEKSRVEGVKFYNADGSITVAAPPDSVTK